jgi:hypothetical protein
MATAFLVLLAAIAVMLALRVKTIRIGFDDEDDDSNRELPPRAGGSAPKLSGKGHRKLKD